MTILSIRRTSPAEFGKSLQRNANLTSASSHPLPRIMTLFLYLNDVEEGGGTSFPLLDVTVQPKKGSALLWPSVLDGAPESKDYRTDHEALPVTKGLKFGANAWIHSRNYRLAEETDCT